MLWTQDRTDFEGRYFNIRHGVANPKPVQKPHPPIWIGSGGPTTLRLTARHADVWNASGSAGQSLETARDWSQRLDEACSEVGRDPSEIRRSAQLPAGSDPAELAERLNRFYAAGFSELIVMMSGGSMPTAKDPAQLAALVAEKVLPALRGHSQRPAALS
jgi:Luciferase-like monooxygenase